MRGQKVISNPFGVFFFFLVAVGVETKKIGSNLGLIRHKSFSLRTSFRVVVEVGDRKYCILITDDHSQIIRNGIADIAKSMVIGVGTFSPKMLTAITNRHMVDVMVYHMSGKEGQRFELNPRIDSCKQRTNGHFLFRQGNQTM